ncbi:glycosyltransferase [Bradyrhizobium sp. 177]|uniref:glycosyltransferase n=1 Tax=Bradyrhizobium sp. 177 TaxID=2782647 RepID=UPI001FFC24B3|nr:glycosyltransferase [Bradyrhizobium sp. 177]MCK1550846.1 glycosyltransferase [Bradyrhizobium sp. 177]
MHLYARWLAEALRDFAIVTRYEAPAVFFTRMSSLSGSQRYFFYLDQFVLLPLILLFWQTKFDVIIVADHSNAPCAFLVSSKKLIVMVHDTIAIRGALGMIPEYDRNVGSLGKLLQRLIVRALKRASAVFANPGPLRQELRDLGIKAHIEVVGCPLDIARLTARPARQPSSLSSSDKFALYVGSDIARKRKRALVDIWRSGPLRDGPYDLVLAGFTDNDNRKLFEQLVPGRIRFVNDASEDELRWLYEHCSFFITASAHEGFCIPVLEASYFRKCVITPDSPFFKEVFGENVKAVLRFDGRDDKRILDTIEQFDPSRSDLSRTQLLATYSYPEFAGRVCRTVDCIAAQRSAT